jgi:hypothetical protein
MSGKRSGVPGGAAALVDVGVVDGGLLAMRAS